MRPAQIREYVVVMVRDEVSHAAGIYVHQFYNLCPSEVNLSTMVPVDEQVWFNVRMAIQQQLVP